MFARLGKLVAAHPIAVVVVWALFACLGVAASLWGFGQGNLFARMETTQFGIPGSGSMVVAEAENDQPEAVSGIVTAIDWQADSAGLAKLVTDASQDIEAMEGVATVLSPFAFDEAMSQADDALAQIEESRDALEAQEAQVRAAREALDGALAQISALPEAAQVAAREQMAAQIAEVEAGESAVAAARTELREAENAARDGRAQAEEARESLIAQSRDGFALVAQFDDGLDADRSQSLDHQVSARMKALGSDIRAVVPSARLAVTSGQETIDAIMDQVQTDLIRGEGVSLPIALIILILVFSGLLAATLPMMGALAAIAIAMGILWAMTYATTVDTFVLNVVSIIGIALSIDYGLLIVSRYREEFGERLARLGLPSDGTVLPAGDELDDVVRRSVSATVATAGRTVIFSAVTIAISICGLFVMRSTTLRIIALGGVIVVLLAVLAASTLVPSLIRVLGPHLLKPSRLASVPGFRHAFAALRDSSSDEGAFSRLARNVQKHPWAIMLSIFAVLIAMALPVRELNLRSNVYEYIPESTDARLAYDVMQSEYPALATDDVIVLVEGNDDDAAAVASWIGKRERVRDVSDPSEWSDGWRLGIDVDSADLVGAPVIEEVQAIRSHRFDTEVYVGGAAAQQHDFTESIKEGAPLALGIVALAVLVLLYLMTGSIIVPIKALIINILSFVASLGVTVWIFTNGYLGLPSTLGMETIVVACSVAFGFGLSMDYEVFLISRMKEHYDAGHDNDSSVAMGLQRSGRIITSAAVAVIAVFVGFVAGDMLAIKEIGVLLAICVGVDATLVRLLLVPATMTVLGDWNWWAPPPLRRLYERMNPTRRTAT